MNNYSVYMHVNKVNNKKYIGITSRNVIDRWNYGNGYIQNTYFYNAIKKYGWDGFEHMVLFINLTKEEACKKEIELIKQYKTQDRKYGYNHSSGGEHGGSGVVSNKRKKVYQYDFNGVFIKEYSHASAARNKISPNSKYDNITECCNGNRSTAFGYRWFYEYLGKKIDALSDPKENIVNARRKDLFQYDLDGHFINSYQSAAEVKRILSINVYNVIEGKTTTAGGYQWFTEYKGKKIKAVKSSSQKLGERQSKKIYMYDSNLNLINIFSSNIDACTYFNTYHKKIKNVIDNNTLFKGYYLCYELKY